MNETARLRRGATDMIRPRIEPSGPGLNQERNARDVMQRARRCVEPSAEAPEIQRVLQDRFHRPLYQFQWIVVPLSIPTDAAGTSSRGTSKNHEEGGTFPRRSVTANRSPKKEGHPLSPDPATAGSGLPMRQRQQTFFDQPFRKTHRSRTPFRLEHLRRVKKKKAKRIRRALLLAAKKKERPVLIANDRRREEARGEQE